MTEFESAVDTVLRSLRPGDVVTYGEVALEAGYSARASRSVGGFLAVGADIERTVWSNRRRLRTRYFFRSGRPMASKIRLA